MKKTVLITGTSTGIGFSTALLFARKGYRVIATMRNVNKNQNLREIAAEEGLNIDVRSLDVTNDSSVQATINDVIQEYRHIDVLINNAGAGFLGALEQTTLAQAQDIMDTNFFGVWRLTQAVFPYMRKNKSGRIITVTSAGGIFGQPFNDAYCAAKFAVEGMMESLAPLARRFGIQVSVVEPGPVNSDFVASVLNISPDLPDNLENDYKNMLDSYLATTKDVFAQMGQKPEEIADVLLAAASEEKMHFRYQTSDASKHIAKLKLTDPTGNAMIALSESRLAS